MSIKTDTAFRRAEEVVGTSSCEVKGKALHESTLIEKLQPMKQAMKDEFKSLKDEMEEVLNGGLDTLGVDMGELGISLYDLPWLALRCVRALFYTVYLIVLQVYHYLLPPPGKNIAGKHVLVTGAGGALGRELALELAREGCRLTCVDVNVAECEETVRLVTFVTRNSATCHRLDVTDRQAVAEFARRLEEEAGPLDILINNAGIVQAGGLLTVSDDQISRIMEVNLMAHFWTIRAFLPAMLKRNSGHVVAISSAAALAVASNIAPYTASKAGVSALMGCLREELRALQSCVQTTTVQPFFLTPPQDKKHWEVRSVLPDVTARSVARSTVAAIKQDAVTVTIPTFLFFVMYMVRFIPAAASDMWRDAFAANIDALKTKTS